MRQTFLSQADQRPNPINVVGEGITILNANDQNKPFEVHVQNGLQGGGPPNHSHPWDEAFYVLEGEVEVSIEDQVHVLSTGGFIQIPANTVHAYKNLSATATILGIVSDCRGGRFFAAMDKSVKTLPDDLDKLLAIGEAHGVNWAFQQ
ncbi:MAG: cupin domain-containing protein [Pseudomonadota bacterium]